MNQINKLLITTLIIFMLSISACFSPWQDNVGTFTINFDGADNARYVYISYDEQETMPFTELVNSIIDEITFSVSITGGPGEEQFLDNIKLNSAKGGSQFSFSVNPGSWTISVEAYVERYYLDEGYCYGKPPSKAGYDDGLYDSETIYYSGETTVTIKPGRNGAVSVDMYLDGVGDNPYEFILVFERCGSDRIADQLEWISKEENVLTGDRFLILVNRNEDLAKTYIIDGFGKNINVEIHSNSSPGTPAHKITRPTTFVFSMLTIKNGANVHIGQLEFEGHGGSSASLINVENNGILYLDGTTITENFVFIGNGGGITVSFGGTLFIYNANIYLNGCENNGGGVYVNGGTVHMYSGQINTNYVNGGVGGGVYIENNGRFYMEEGAEIFGSDLGVYVFDNSSFIMNGGKISDNNCGVFVGSEGTFTMNSGNITLNGTESGTYRSGVRVDQDGIFFMKGGNISFNGKAGVAAGGGVYVAGFFNMNGGDIFSNNAGNGGGVYVAEGTFSIDSGNIYSNSASTSGGGVSVTRPGEFLMWGGKIYNNNATTLYGGGVNIYESYFSKMGGIIYGIDDSSLQNTATSLGNAVYTISANQFVKVINDTVGEYQNILFDDRQNTTPVWEPDPGSIWIDFP